jgi:hypothetical protein
MKKKYEPPIIKELQMPISMAQPVCNPFGEGAAPCQSGIGAVPTCIEGIEAKAS